jgi:hypothetical protein
MRRTIYVRPVFIALTFFSIMAFLVVVAVLGVRQGLQRFYEPRDLFNDGLRSWQNGEPLHAMQKISRAGLLSLEGEARWQLADKLFLTQMRYWYSREEFSRALIHCQNAVKVLGPYDGEGMIGYYCGVINLKIMAIEESNN